MDSSYATCQRASVSSSVSSSVSTSVSSPDVGDGQDRPESVGPVCAAGAEPRKAAVSRAERLPPGTIFADDVSIVQFDLP